MIESRRQLLGHSIWKTETDLLYFHWNAMEEAGKEWVGVYYNSGSGQHVSCQILGYKKFKGSLKILRQKINTHNRVLSTETEEWRISFWIWLATFSAFLVHKHMQHSHGHKVATVSSPFSILEGNWHFGKQGVSLCHLYSLKAPGCNTMRQLKF